MALSRVGKDCGKQDKSDKDSLLKGGMNMIGQRKSVFGKYADSDMLSWIRGLAMDPCRDGLSRDSVRPFLSQTLEVRKALSMSDTEFPRRKRKLQQFLKNKIRVTNELAPEVLSQQKVAKLSRSQLSRASSVSCLLDPVDSTESLNPKTILTSCGSGSILTDWGLPNNDFCPLVDSDESVSGSNPSSPENPIVQDPHSLGLGDPVHNSSTSSSEEPRRMHLQTPRQSIRLLNFIGDNLQRMVIPVGPRFQADIPVWTGPAKKLILDEDYAESENSRFLGTLVWPIKAGRRTKTTSRVIGQGRADSCSCVSPGSTDCIKHHVLKEKLLLQSELGPAFFSWKFDDMGEEVSKSWTLEEQQSFAFLVKKYSISNGKSFMKPALNHFQSKCKESIVSYYFNVFIPRHISKQNRLSIKELDSDNEEADDKNHTNFMERCKGRSTMMVGILNSLRQV